MNKFFEVPSKIDFNEPNYEERQFFDRIRKIIELITLMDEKQGELDHIISKECHKYLKNLKSMYENLLDIDPRDLPEVRFKIEKNARKLYHSLD